MPLKRLDLNLVPAPTLWERHHLRLGWGGLALGLAALLSALGVSGWTYWQARKAGQEAVFLTSEARRAAQEQQRLEAQLAEVDVGRELPRWRTAERVLQERALPWSRLLAELEMDLPDGVRLRGIQRVRGREGVSLKLKGEAKLREAEEAFIDALRANPTYAALALERESERQGSGLEFELALAAAGVPPAFASRPHPQVKVKAQPGPAATPVKTTLAPPSSAPAFPTPGNASRPQPPVKAVPPPAPPAPAFSTPSGPAAPSLPTPRPSQTFPPQRPIELDRPGAMPMRRTRPPRRAASSEEAS